MKTYDPPFREIPVYCDVCKEFTVQYRGQHLKCNGHTPIETAIYKMPDKLFEKYSQFKKTTRAINTAVKSHNFEFV